MRKTELGRDYIFGIIVYFQWLRGHTAYNVASLFWRLVASPRNRESVGCLQRDTQPHNFLYRVKDDGVRSLF